jgi:Bacterial Ig-like domain
MGTRELMHHSISCLALCAMLFGSCSKEKNAEPIIQKLEVNGFTDHLSLEAGAMNTIKIIVADNDAVQVKLSLSKDGLYANHDHGFDVNYYGLLIPNHGDFAFDAVKNISELTPETAFTFTIPNDNSGLWKMNVQVLDDAGNLTSMSESLAINSMTFPNVSISAMNPDLELGEGRITGAINTTWNWSGSVFDFDSLSYVHATIQQNGDTISSYINNNPSTWSLPLNNIPMAMPDQPGQYQWRLELMDYEGNQTWRTSTLVVE